MQQPKLVSADSHQVNSKARRRKDLKVLMLWIVASKRLSSGLDTTSLVECNIQASFAASCMNDSGLED